MNVQRSHVRFLEMNHSSKLSLSKESPLSPIRNVSSEYFVYRPKFDTLFCFVILLLISQFFYFLFIYFLQML